MSDSEVSHFFIRGLFFVVLSKSVFKIAGQMDLARSWFENRLFHFGEYVRAIGMTITRTGPNILDDSSCDCNP